MRSPITAQHILALENPPEAMALLLHVVAEHGAKLDPSTQRPRLCGWSMGDLYNRCVEAARLTDAVRESV